MLDVHKSHSRGGEGGGGGRGGVLHGGLNWHQATRSCEKCTTFLDIRAYY